MYVYACVYVYHVYTHHTYTHKYKHIYMTDVAENEVSFLDKILNFFPQNFFPRNLKDQLAFFPVC